ncbi:hypothetical protein [Paraburkholderia sp. DHOC27]|uniref:hypothetical protein n=1 Tax=Paraburkholderia sp. DHOC27 TaxID=2303330 RepID=UPI0011C17BFA|nr:hypothetical protein [Paraburkholderia sp. DHOC27]
MAYFFVLVFSLDCGWGLGLFLVFLFLAVFGFLGFFGFFAFPCFLIGLFALPLCGAAPTFLCRRKEK